MQIHCFSDYSFFKKQAQKLFCDVFHDLLEAFEYYWQEADLEHSFFIMDDNQIVCMCLNTQKLIYCHFSKTYQKCLSISGVCVHESYQNRKLSKQLLQHVLSKCESNFDLILLQAYDWKYYQYLNFFDAELTNRCFISNKIQKSDIKVHQKTNFQSIDWKLVYQIFLASQTQQACSLLWTFQMFQNYCMYKIMNEELLVYDQKAFCFYDNNFINAYGFVQFEDLIQLVKQIQLEESIIDLPDHLYQQLILTDLQVQSRVQKINLKTNKQVDNQFAIHLWSEFI